MALTPREWRKAKGYSIEAVAKAVDVSPVTWAKWEEKPSLIPIGKADQFCKMLGITSEVVIFLP